MTAESRYDRDRARISDNFKNHGQRLDALEDVLEELLTETATAGGVIDEYGVADWDEFFAWLPDRWTQFGKGPMSELVEGSPEVVARNRVVELTWALVERAGTQGRNVSYNEASKAAVIFLY